MPTSPTTTAADPYKDLSPDQRARVEKALAKAKTKVPEPQEDSTPAPETNGAAVHDDADAAGTEVATAEPVVDGEVINDAEIVTSRTEPVRRSRAVKAELRKKNTLYQVCEPLAADDMEALRKSVLTNGVMVPVVIDADGIVLDGHNRVTIAVDNDLPIPTVIVDLQTDAEKRALAWELNRARRQMTEEQKDELRYQLVVIEGRSPAEVAKELGEGRNTTIRKARKKAEEIAAANGDAPSPGEQDDSPAPVLPSEQKRQKIIDAIKADPKKSDRQIAQETGISQPTVSRTRKKVNEGRQVIKKEHTKKLTIHDEFARAVTKLSKAADELVRLQRDSRAARSGAKLWEANGQEIVAIINKMSEVSGKLSGKK